MHAHMPPFGRKVDAKPEHAYRAPEAPISDREADLRTLKHYLYHAGLLVEKLLAAQEPQLLNVTTVDGERYIEIETGLDFARDRDATGA